MRQITWLCLVVYFCFYQVSGTVRYDCCNRRCQSVGGRLQNCARVRKDFTSMTSEERRLYIATFITASTRQPYKTQFDRLIRLHFTLFSTSIHSSTHFLPWHRWYLLQLENLLRRINCKVTVPYWDWSLYSHDPWSRSHMWSSSNYGFGGNGRGRDRCVRDGPFAAHRWSVSPSARAGGRSCLTRDFNGNPPDAPAIQIAIKTAPHLFSSFEEHVRVNLHERVHCNFATERHGLMCGEHSAAAPEFFLHHGFIDKIWNDWQKLSRAHARAYLAGRNRRMTGTMYTPQQLLNIERQPGNVRVLYDDPSHNNARKILSSLKGKTAKQLEQLPRHPFSKISTSVFKVFHVSNRERAISVRFDSQMRPRNVAVSTTLQGYARTLGFSPTG